MNDLEATEPTTPRGRGRPRTVDGAVAINVKLPADVWARLHAVAHTNGTSMSDVMRRAVSSWLDEYEAGRRKADF